MKFLKRKNIGSIAKQFVSDLFTESGFEVYQLGYESVFSTIKNRVRNNEDEISLRIRTMPDILVINNKNNKPQLIEVKYRSYPSKIDIKEKELQNYKKFWPEAFIICVVPDEVGFYIQKISNINPEGKISILEGKRVIALDIKNNFHPISNFPEFKDIKESVINELKEMINKIGFFRTG